MATHLLQGLRSYSAEREIRQPPKTTVHVAICVPDQKLARKVKRDIRVLAQPNWPGSVKMHILVGNESGLDDEMRVLLASLRMVNHHDLDLIHDTELEIGWTDEPRPTSTT